MRKLVLLTIIFMLLSGCWSKFELTERGFVMGVALDWRDDGKIEMLTQIYRPVSAESGHGTSGASQAIINISTSDDTVIESIRDIAIHLGRRAQWSHMRVIIVGEELAKKADIMNTLDMFFRDHEPRSSVSLLIAKGKASKLLEKTPLIEQTTSQQILRTSTFSFRNAAKTLDTTLLDLALQMKSVNQDAVVAYVYGEKGGTELWSAAGLVMLKKGRMIGTIPPSKVEGLLMLLNKYRTGIVESACKGGKGQKEAVEILSLKVKQKPIISGEEVRVKIEIESEVAITELKCTKLATLDDERRFLERFEEAMRRQVQSAVTHIQKEKADVIGIGNMIYAKKPAMWQKLKGDWDQRFAEIPFDIHVTLKLVTGGTISSRPLS